MYARILEGRLSVDASGEAINYFRQSVAPALRQQPGFVSGRLLSDPTTDDWLLLLLWESEADRAMADDNGFLQTLLGHLGVYFVRPPIRRSYELTALVGN